MSKYTIEKHGDGYAIYLGRDWQHHGANIGHLTEVTPATIKLIQDALNATLAQPANQSDCGHEEYNPLCQMCMATKQKPWDTSDMAHRTGGLSVEECVDRGAWSDVPDATKWVDELRGDEDSEQAPVAYFWRDTKLCYWIGHGSPKIDFQDLANLDVKPLYTAPPSKPWVSLTGDEIDDIAAESGFGYINVARAIEAKLKEKNT